MVHLELWFSEWNNVARFEDKNLLDKFEILFGKCGIWLTTLLDQIVQYVSMFH